MLKHVSIFLCFSVLSVYSMDTIIQEPTAYSMPSNNNVQAKLERPCCGGINVSLQQAGKWAAFGFVGSDGVVRKIFSSSISDNLTDQEAHQREFIRLHDIYFKNTQHAHRIPERRSHGA